MPFPIAALIGALGTLAATGISAATQAKAPPPPEAKTEMPAPPVGGLSANIGQRQAMNLPRQTMGQQPTNQSLAAQMLQQRRF